MNQTDVVFDVGHYPFPNEPGAYNRTLDSREHDWCHTLAHACMWRAKERRLYSVATVTRETTISAQCQKINAMNPRFVVSFHLNGFQDPRATGTETLHWRTSARSKRNAGIIQRNMVHALGLRDRGLLATTGIPQLGPMTTASIVLIEPGFLTNDTDMFCLHERYQALIEAIVYGVWEVLNG